MSATFTRTVRQGGYSRIRGLAAPGPRNEVTCPTPSFGTGESDDIDLDHLRFHVDAFGMCNYLLHHISCPEEAKDSIRKAVDTAILELDFAKVARQAAEQALCVSVTEAVTKALEKIAPVTAGGKAALDELLKTATGDGFVWIDSPGPYDY